MGKEFHIKKGGKILAIIRNFSATEKFVFGVIVIVAIVSSLTLAVKANGLFMTPVPAEGGSYSEGVVGLPRYINPVLAFTDIDKDLSALVYSGLMKYEDGVFVPDLVETYEISKDGLVYTFTLKEGLRFHDGSPLTTDDVEFTIQKVQDGVIKSPKRADWANVSINKIDSRKIEFSLKQAYAPFLSNTTLGIIPKHIWNKVDADQFIYSNYNIEPIGSGPYELKLVKRDNGGIPQYYNFSPFSRYHDNKAYIRNIFIYFYPNEKAAVEAYKLGIIEGVAGISPHEAGTIASSTSNTTIVRTPLPRVFGVFFNQNQAPVLAQSEIRKALDLVTDKKAIINKVLLGYGVESYSPIPGKSTGSNAEKIKTGSSTNEEALSLLSKAGWVMGDSGSLEKKDSKGNVTGKLEFSISTVDAPDLKEAAEIIKSQWESIGAKVTIKVFEYGDLYQNIISTRKYDALLFGEFIGKDLDLYAFWHSSQRNAPGLNVASYVNSKADKLLEEARGSSDEKIRAEKYAQFEKIIQDEVPAVFLYSPEFIYILPKKLQGLELQKISSPSDRFSNVSKWYIETSGVWKIFNKEEI